MTVYDSSAPPPPPPQVPNVQQALLDLRKQVRAELDGVVIGAKEALDLMIVAAVAGGHVLLEGPPGVAKTLMASGIARVLGVSFRRVQFTPDTRPEEITGELVRRRGEETFSPGAVFTNVLLADEINRTPPRTQAALLEAMQERHVTVAGRTRWLPTPFMVVATQNPYEQLGIFPLPESQLDRFLFKVTLASTPRSGSWTRRVRPTTSPRSSSTSSAARASPRVSCSARARARPCTC